MKLDIRIPPKMDRDATVTFKCNGDLKDRVGKKLKSVGMKWVDIFEGLMLAIDEGELSGDIKLTRKR